MKRALPPLVLLFLAPAVSQLLSAELAPSEFFSPFGLTILPIVYGGAAILIRDIVKRWGKGWASLLALGAAYGIIREGLMLKSFFDPFSQGIDVLGYYGRWAGINWIWALDRTVYHSIISIGIPILITEIIIPSGQKTVWLAKWPSIVLAILLVMNVAFGYFFGTDYQAGVLRYWLTAMAAAVLVLIAWRLPRKAETVKAPSMKSPVLFWLAGFLGTIVYMLIFWWLPNTSIPAVITGVLGIVLIAIVILLVMRLSRNAAEWDDRHRLALASGPLFIFIIMTPIEELSRFHAGGTPGMILVGLGALILLVWLHWRTIKRIKEVKSG